MKYQKPKPTEFIACILVMKDGWQVRGFAKWDAQERQYIYTAQVSDLPDDVRATIPPTAKHIVALTDGHDLVFDGHGETMQ